MSSDPTTRLNAALEGRYRIESELGEGGMATVYLADDLKHERKVALKVLKPELAATMGPDRFLQEVRVTANLQHPHILALFDSGEADGFLYYVMPFLEGESLGERVAREGELPVAQVVSIIREVVDALAAAHEAGVVHRDIKPDNVMLSGRHAVVTDFGVAKAVSDAAGDRDVTTKGVALGTPTYMAPEQAAANEHIDHRADIYAVGVMAYELLTGRPPFTGKSAQQILASHVMEMPRPVTELRASVSPNLAGIVMRCLEKKPADRWQSADELHAQLSAFQTPPMGVTPVQSQPTKGFVGPPRWMKAAIPLAGAAVIAMIWVVAQGGGEAGDQADTDVATEGLGAESTERIVVMPLRNITENPDLDILGRLAADAMGRAIDQPRPLPVVPSSTVSTAIIGLGEGATTEAVAVMVRARYAFAGTIAEVAGRLRFDVELIDVESGERLRTLETVAGPMEAADSLVAAIAGATATLSVTQLDPDAPVWSRFSTPPVSIAAFEAYVEQGAIFCQGDNAGSIPPGERAIELSPGYVAAANILMVAHSNLGNDIVADSLIDLLNGWRDRTTQIERLTLDWMIGNRTSDPGMAERAIEEAYRIDPVGVGGSAALTAYRSRRMEDAIERMQASSPSFDVCPWPGIWTQGAVPYHTLGRLEEERMFAQQGLSYHPGHRTMMDSELRTYAAYGRLEQVDSLLGVMSNLPPTNSDRNFRRLYAGMELKAHGYVEEGERYINETLDNWTSNRPPYNDLYNHARALNWGGRFAEAEVKFRQLIDEYPDHNSFGTFLREYGVALARQGRVEEARDVMRQLADLRDPRRTGLFLWGQGVIAAVLGEREEALRLLQESFDAGRLFNIAIHREPALAEMWGYGPFDALMAPR